jgi:hypothetical protein
VPGIKYGQVKVATTQRRPSQLQQGDSIVLDARLWTVVVRLTPSHYLLASSVNEKRVHAQASFHRRSEAKKSTHGGLKYRTEAVGSISEFDPLVFRIRGDAIKIARSYADIDEVATEPEESSDTVWELQPVGKS